MKTRITELFGIKYPIMCGGMLWLGKPELCAAISNAGGLGESLLRQITIPEQSSRQRSRKTKKLTDKPFWRQCYSASFLQNHPGDL